MTQYTSFTEQHSSARSSIKLEADRAFQRLSHELPPGLHRAMRQMLQSLMGVAVGRSASLFGDLAVEVTAARVLVGPASDDPVVHGIQRRFTVRATQTCHQCGRRGRARRDLGGRVRCARCAAPGLLFRAVQQGITQACTSKDFNVEVNAAELPPLLRPMFLMHVGRLCMNEPGAGGSISRETNADWLKLLRDLASEMRHDRVLVP